MESILDSVNISHDQPYDEQVVRGVIESGLPEAIEASKPVTPSIGMTDDTFTADEPFEPYSGPAPQGAWDSMATGFKKEVLTGLTISDHWNSKFIFNEQLTAMNEEQEALGLETFDFSVFSAFNSADSRSKYERQWKHGYSGVPEEYVRYFEAVERTGKLNAKELGDYTTKRVKEEYADLNKQSEVNQHGVFEAIGGMGGIMTDPVMIATLPLGSEVIAPALTGKAITTTAFRAGVQEMKIAALAEVPMQAVVYDYKHNDLGMEYSLLDAVGNGTLGMIGAGVIRGAGSAVVDVVRAKRLPGRLQGMLDEYGGKITESDVFKLYEEAMVLHTDIAKLRADGISRGYTKDEIEHAIDIHIMDELSFSRGAASTIHQKALEKFAAEGNIGPEATEDILIDMYSFISDLHMSIATNKAGTAINTGIADTGSEPLVREVVTAFTTKYPFMKEYADELLAITELDASGVFKRQSTVDNVTTVGMERLAEVDPDLHKYLKERMATNPHDSLETMIKHYQDVKYKGKPAKVELDAITARQDITNVRADRIRSAQYKNLGKGMTFEDMAPTTINQARAIEPPKTVAQEKLFPEVDMDAPITQKEKIDLKHEALYESHVTDLRKMEDSLEYKQYKALMDGLAIKAKLSGKKSTPKEKQDIIDSTIGQKAIDDRNVLARKIKDKETREVNRPQADKVHKAIRLKKIREKATGKKEHPTPKEVENRLAPYKALADLLPEDSAARRISEADVNRARDEMNAGRTIDAVEEVNIARGIDEMAAYADITARTLDDEVTFSYNVSGESTITINGTQRTTQQMEEYMKEIGDTMSRIGC